MTGHGRDAVYVVAGGDLVVACTSEAVADAQYTVMVGANLDVERWIVRLDQWVKLRRELEESNPELTITDLTERTNDEQ